MRSSLLIAASLALVGFSTPGQTQVIESGSGSGATTARDAFRTDLGGGTIAGANGSFGGVRREINWDGVPATFSAPNSMPADFFNVNSPRGAVFTTAGTGFQVSGATTDAGAGQPAAANFGNIDPSYSATFAPFSPQRLFTPIGSNVFDILFYSPGTTTPALTTGFGAIFSDVDLLNTTSIELFGAGGNSLGIFYVPVASSSSQGLSFLGISYSTPTISRVRITAGNTALGSGVVDTLQHDVVVLDDFIFGEPGAVPEPSTWAMMLFGFGAIAFQVRRQPKLTRKLTPA